MSDSQPAAPTPADAMRILLTTAPPDVAHGLARALVEERLAACVNVVPGVRSVYRWEGALQDDPETLLLVKTTAARLAALEARLLSLHPYEIPERVVLSPSEVAPPYLAWLLEAASGGGGDAPSSA